MDHGKPGQDAMHGQYKSLTTKPEYVHSKKTPKFKNMSTKKPSKKLSKSKYTKALQWALDNNVYSKIMAMGTMTGAVFGFVAEPNRQHIFSSTVLCAIAGFVGAAISPVVVPVMIVGVPARVTYWYFQANIPSQLKNE